MKKIISMMLVIIMLSSIILTSCTKGNNGNEGKVELKGNNDVIQIWYFEHGGLGSILGGILPEIEEFCKKKIFHLKL